MTLVHPSVAKRRNIKKFGDSANLPSGPDSNTTSLDEVRYLKLSFGMQENKVVEEEVDPLKKAASVGILCRICKGNHFSSKCPYKDTYQPLDVIQSTIDQVKESTTTDPTKYVPPSMRNRTPGAPGDSMPKRDELPTIRITNLSEDATEADVRQLVSKFGSTSRCVSFIKLFNFLVCC
jgi:translation initiation factor 3 subunit G